MPAVNVVGRQGSVSSTGVPSNNSCGGSSGRCNTVPTTMTSWVTATVNITETFPPTNSCVPTPQSSQLSTTTTVTSVIQSITTQTNPPSTVTSVMQSVTTQAASPDVVTSVSTLTTEAQGNTTSALGTAAPVSATGNPHGSNIAAPRIIAGVSLGAVGLAILIFLIWHLLKRRTGRNINSGTRPNLFLRIPDEPPPQRLDVPSRLSDESLFPMQRESSYCGPMPSVQQVLGGPSGTGYPFNPHYSAEVGRAL